MNDPRDTLIANQQLKIQQLEEENFDLSKRLNTIYMRIFSCGGPLNGNYNSYTQEQLKSWFEIAKLTGRY